MRRSLGTVVFLACLLLGPALAALADQPPPDLMRAAEAQAPGWLERVAGLPPEHFGLTEPLQPGAFTLGQPYEVFTFSLGLDDTQGYAGDAARLPPLTTTQHWLFPVLGGGKVRFFFEMAFSGGEWRAVGVGNAGLAQQIDAMHRRVPGLLRARGVTAQPLVRLVRFDDLDFLAVDGAGEQHVLLPEWGRMLQLAQGELLRPGLLLAKFAEAQRQGKHPGLQGGLGADADEAANALGPSQPTRPGAGSRNWRLPAVAALFCLLLGAAGIAARGAGRHSPA